MRNNKETDMNKKKLSLFSILSLALLLTTACTQNNANEPELGKGDFKLSLTTNSEVIPVLRSNSDVTTIAPVPNDFAVTLTNEDGSFSKTWSTLANIAEGTTYDVGAYTLSATYSALENEGFETPYYYGETKFAIRDQETTPVEVVCSLGHVKLSLNFTDAFKAYFPEYKATVRTVGGKDVVFEKKEIRDAYVRPGDITIKLNLTTANGTTATIEPTKIKGAKEREHYIVTLDVSENVGASYLSIVFDNETVVEPITINVSEEAMVAPAPYINLDGVENNGSIEAQECERFKETLGASIIARGGISSCTLITTSSYLLSLGFPTEVDLCNLTDEQNALFNELGFGAAGFDDNTNIMSFINFGSLLPLLQINEEGNTDHTFTITARDNNGKVSEPATFTIHTTPLELTLSEIDNVILGATSVDGPVVTNAKNIEDLAIVNVTGGGEKRVPYTIVAQEGNNYTLRANMNVENKQQELKLVYNNRRSTQSKHVGITVPSYTFHYNDYDIWGTHAIFSVVANDAQYQSLIEKYITYYIAESGNWKEIVTQENEGGLLISGLTAETEYSIHSACLADKSDIENNSILRFKTEDELELPNSNFEYWNQVTAMTINKGGRYGKFMGWTQETTNLTVKNPEGWTTVNSKTVPTSPKTKNSWYMVPSTLSASGVSGNAALLRNVAWSNNGSTPPEGSWGGLINQGLEYLTPPSIDNRSAGKMFLGTYNYNHSNGAETYNEGISFTSRPTKLSGFYKYIPKGNDQYGVVTITIEHRAADGSVIVLATGTKALEPVTASFINFEVALNYTDVKHKATHIKVMFASSNNASYDQATENINITTIDNKYQAISIGSELYIDNLKLTY